MDDLFPEQLDRWIERTDNDLRIGLHMLLLEARERLQELAELRRLTASYELRGVWPDGDEQPDVLPDRIVFVGEDGEPEPRFAVDARPLLEEVLRRQAKLWVEQHSDGEGPELGALLSLVPHDLDLLVLGAQPGYQAAWEEAARPLAKAEGATPEAAIRAATLKLLGIDAAEAQRRRSGGAIR